MACQSNPNTYAVVFRCPLKEGARLKTLADEAGQTISAYVAQIVHERIGSGELTEAEQMWLDEHLAANTARRIKQDEWTARGYYKKRHRGRPRKPGPRKGWKKKAAKQKEASENL